MHTPHSSEEQSGLDKKDLDDILNSIFSALPGNRYISNIGYKRVFEIISSNHKILLKIIIPIIIAWSLIFTGQFITYLIVGQADCRGQLGPFLPSFFCLGDQKPVTDALSRFISTTFWFIVVVELLLLLQWAMGAFSRTKYNVTIPRILTYVFWVLVAGVVLIYFGLMIVG